MTRTKNHTCTTHKQTAIATAVALMTLGTMTSSNAQDSSATTQARSTLESVVVTANRRVEKLEKVPQSISVVSTEDLERNNVREFDDLANLAPALVVQTGTQVGTNSINMRGIGSLSNNLGIEGDVVVILDDLPFAQAQQAFKDLADVARVEVLKGPQSTLFGKSAIAGAVVVTTAPIGNSPVKTKLSTYMTNDGEYRVGGSISGRVAEGLGLRVSASKSDFRGLVHNLTNDSYTNGSKGDNINAKLEWNVTPDLDASLYAFYSDSKSTGNASVLTALGPAAAKADIGAYSLIRNNAELSVAKLFAGITASEQNKDARFDDESGLNQKDKGYSLRFNYIFPERSALAGHALTSITGFNGNDSWDYRDNDRSEGKTAYWQPLTNAAGVTGPATSPSRTSATEQINGYAFIKTYTQDVRLTSPDSGNFRYLAGLWFSDTTLDRTYVRGLYGIKSSNYTNYATGSDTKNMAIYANSTWEFMPNHTLTLGGRFGQETNNYNFTTISALAATAPANTPYLPYYAYTAPENVETAFTGKAAYAYNISPETMVYTSYATGRKGVAYDMTSGANNKNVFEYLPLAAETAKSYEVGFKSNMLENRATLNVSLFRSDFKDLQASSTQTFSDGSSASVLYSVPGAQTKGLEFDFKWLASKEWLLGVSYAYTEATITDWDYGACYSGRTDCTRTPPNPRNPTATYHDGAGFEMQNSPRNKGTISAQYSSRLGPYKAAYNLQARGQSDVQGSVDQNPTNQRPGLAIFDIGMNLATDNSRYKLGFGVKNLFDRQYSTGGQGGVVGSLLSPTGAASTANLFQNGWKPARDAFRYYWVRLDVSL